MRSVAIASRQLLHRETGTTARSSASEGQERGGAGREVAGAVGATRGMGLANTHGASL